MSEQCRLAAPHRITRASSRHGAVNTMRGRWCLNRLTSCRRWLEAMQPRGLHGLVVPVMLAMISTYYVCRTVILPNVEKRIAHVDRILTGQAQSPYQFRILKPLLGTVVETMASTVVRNRRMQHVFSYASISMVTFLAIFICFHRYLWRGFGQSGAIVGVLLLQVVIPLSVTGYYMEGDFITLWFYTLGLALFRSGRVQYLPVIVFLGALNREQIAFLIVWYVIDLVAQRRLDRRGILLALASLLLWAVAMLGTRAYYGAKPTQFTTAFHIASNSNVHDLLTSIVPLWTVEVAGFALLSTVAFRKSDAFHRLAFLSLLPYTILFFFNGLLRELAKFLPAFLIMIPMALRGVLDGNPSTESSES